MMTLPIGITQQAAGSAVGPWEYADLATAEASSDPWINGDQVTITGGAVFTYISALAVDGYSGLIHKEPYGSGLGTLSVAAPVLSEAEGVDPDSWDEHDDNGTGTKGVDYENDTNGGLARLRKLTTAGKARMDADAAQPVTTGDEETMFLCERLVATNTASSSGYSRHTVTLRSYVGASDFRYVRLDAENDGDSIYWSVQHTDGTTWAESTIDRRNENRLFLYLKNGRWALWSGSDSTPELSGTVPRTLTSANRNEHNCGEAGGTYVASQSIGRFIVGNMTTA